LKVINFFFFGGINVKKKHRVLKEIGKVIVNFGNLIFAGLVIGSIIKGDYDRLTTLWFGSCFVLVLITVGIIMLTAGEE
jgi:hypothetical protein